MAGAYRKRKDRQWREKLYGETTFTPDPNFNAYDHIRKGFEPTKLQLRLQEHIEDLRVMLNDPRCPQSKDELRTRIADLEQHANKRVEPVLPTPEPPAPPTPDRRPRAPTPPPPEPEWAPDAGWMQTTSSTMFTGGFGGSYGSKFKSKEDKND